MHNYIGRSGLVGTEKPSGLVGYNKTIYLGVGLKAGGGRI